MFKVTKRFTSGLLQGLVITEVTSVQFHCGQVVAKPAGGSSPYVVVAVEAA
jgi:hypothetical protein